MSIKVITRMDCLRGIEKKEYLQGGQVYMYSIFDSIEKVPSYDEINKMEIEAGNKLLTSIKQKFKVKDLAKHWGISDYTMYHALYPKFGIPTNYTYKRQKGDKKKNNGTEHRLSLPDNKQSFIDTDEIKKQVTQMSQAAIVVKNGVEEIMTKIKNTDADGFNIRLKGDFDGKALQNRLLRIGEMLEESIRYEVSLVINEIREGDR